MQYVELEFAARFESPARLPKFVGATLRGAFGHLLKQAVCQVSHGDCSRCLLQAACPYPAVFDGVAPADRDFMRKYPNVPQPFVLVVPTPESSDAERNDLTWGVRLFGNAIRFWPYVVHVFQVAGERGIGRDRAKFELLHVRDCSTGANLWLPEEQISVQPAQLRCDPGDSVPDACALRWRFETPLRIRRGDRQQRSLSGLDLLVAGRRRFRIMNHFYGDASAAQEERFEPEEFTVREQHLQKWGFDRFSGRQKRRMTLDGLLGNIVIDGPWGRVGRWLHAVKSIHLGKATSFGFGRVDWEVA